MKAQGDLEQWLKDGTGPLTSNVGEVAAFIRTVDPPVPVSGPKPKDYGSGSLGPDIEIIGTPMAYLNHGEEGAPPGSEVFSMVPIGLRPQSKGTIEIKSKNVFDPREFIISFFSFYANLCIVDADNIITCIFQ